MPRRAVIYDMMEVHKRFYKLKHKQYEQQGMPLQQRELKIYHDWEKIKVNIKRALNHILSDQRKLTLEDLSITQEDANQIVAHPETIGQYLRRRTQNSNGEQTAITFKQPKNKNISRKAGYKGMYKFMQRYMNLPQSEMDDEGEDEQQRRNMEIQDSEDDEREWQVIEHQNENTNWKYLEHNGLMFQQPYKPQNITLRYHQQEITLTPLEEELAYQWCREKNSQYTTKKIFQKNFQEQFITSIAKRYPQVQSIQNINFDRMNKFVEQENERKKEEEKSEQFKNKTKMYWKVIIDGRREKIGSIATIRSKLYHGAGESKRSGRLVAPIRPEQTILNISRDAPIPKLRDMPGRNWGQIVSNQEAIWICKYKNSVRLYPTYVEIHKSSKIAQDRDRQKFEKARKLKEEIEFVEIAYKKSINSSNLESQQLGTATYLLHRLALRVGNEVDTESAKTQGCCTLEVQNIQLLPQNCIKLKFKGKYSITFNKEPVSVIPQVWNNLQKFCRFKYNTDLIFDKIDAPKLDKYLDSIMPGLTAKVFRTYLASDMTQQHLNSKDLKKKSLRQKLRYFKQTNDKIAELCNHLKTDQKTKEGKKIQAQQKFRLNQKKEQSIEEQLEHSDYEAEGKNMKENSENESQEMEYMQPSRQTSKANYIDPRIIYTWCKKNQISSNSRGIYSNQMMRKFKWAEKQVNEAKQPFKF